MLLSAVAIGLVVAAFVLGWIIGYNKSCRAHGWYLPRVDSREML
jgi:hypothetical protein